MKFVKLSFLYPLLFLLYQFCWSGPITMILQNGLNNYSGCEDSWLWNSSQYSSTNFGNSQSIETKYALG